MQGSQKEIDQVAFWRLLENWGHAVQRSGEPEQVDCAKTDPTGKPVTHLINVVLQGERERRHFQEMSYLLRLFHGRAPS